MSLDRVDRSRWPLVVVNRHHWCRCPGRLDELGCVVGCRCGRSRRLPVGAVYVGRGTPLGNPYRYPEHPDALELYRRWLWSRLRAEDAAVLGALRALREGDYLVCSCAPRPCHADVIVRAWVWLTGWRPGVAD